MNLATKHTALQRYRLRNKTIRRNLQKEIMKPQSMDIQALIILVLIGLAAGVLSGLVGVGGGIILVPALVYFLNYNQHQAQGTSLGVLTFPVTILAFLTYYRDCVSTALPLNSGDTHYCRRIYYWRTISAAQSQSKSTSKC